MQYHYVVGYDSETNDWFVEWDTTAYFHDGNVFSNESAVRTGYGWIVPDEDSDELRIDYDCLRILESCVPGILPTPKKEN